MREQVDGVFRPGPTLRFAEMGVILGFNASVGRVGARGASMMTESQLAEIEAAIGFPLPEDYRRVAREFPFRPIGIDGIYWFYQDQRRVIEETIAPLADGGYNLEGWQQGYVTIGRGPEGDLYVLDTQTEGLPVLCLSHETHAIEPEWPSFRDFVDEWLRAPEEIRQRIDADTRAAAAEQSARMQRGMFVVAAILVACLLFPLILALFIKRELP